MSKSAFYNGILYQIEYQPQLSNSDYTQHKVYHIKTEDENYPHARKAIASIMEDELGYKQGEIWNKGLYQLKNDKEPSMLNALHVYYEFSYNNDLESDFPEFIDTTSGGDAYSEYYSKIY